MKIRTRLKRKNSAQPRKKALNKPCSLALRVTAAVIVMLLPADMRADWVAEGVTPSLTTQMPLLHNSARLSICGFGLFVVYSLLGLISFILCSCGGILPSIYFYFHSIISKFTNFLCLFG